MDNKQKLMNGLRDQLGSIQFYELAPDKESKQMRILNKIRINTITRPKFEDRLGKARDLTIVKPGELIG